MGATGGHRRLLCLDGGRAVLDSGQRHFDGPPYLGSVRGVLHMCVIFILVMSHAELCSSHSTETVRKDREPGAM